MASSLRRLRQGLAQAVGGVPGIPAATPEDIAEINEVMLQNAIQGFRNSLDEQRKTIDALTARLGQQEGLVAGLSARLSASKAQFEALAATVTLSASKAQVEALAATVTRDQQVFANHTHLQSGTTGTGYLFSKEMNSLVVIVSQSDAEGPFHRRTEVPDVTT